MGAGARDWRAVRGPRPQICECQAEGVRGTQQHQTARAAGEGCSGPARFWWRGPGLALCARVGMGVCARV